MKNGKADGGVWIQYNVTGQIALLPLENYI